MKRLSLNLLPHLFVVALSASALSSPGVSAAELRVDGERCYLKVSDRDLNHVELESDPILEVVRTIFVGLPAENLPDVDRWIEGLRGGREDTEALAAIGQSLSEATLFNESDLRSFSAFFINLVSNSKTMIISYGDHSGVPRDRAKELLEAFNYQSDQLVDLEVYGVGATITAAVGAAVRDFVRSRDDFFRQVLSSCVSGESTYLQLGEKDDSVGKGMGSSTRVGVGVLVGVIVAAAVAAFSLFFGTGIVAEMKKFVTLVTA